VVDELSDSAVILASLGEPDRFGPIFDRHFSSVFGFIGAAVRPDFVADIAAEVFARAFEQRGRYNSEYRSARPWLLGIASNLIADHYRKRDREERAYRRTLTREIDSHTFEDDSSERVDAERMSPVLQRALRELRSEEVSVVVLFVVDDLSYREIALALTIPEGTVRSRWSRARVRLRNSMEASGELNPGETNE
jgi:RNA polymerase sigma-70 factor (ECF subfamily)